MGKIYFVSDFDVLTGKVIADSHACTDSEIILKEGS